MMQEDVSCRSASMDRVGMRCALGLSSPSLPGRDTPRSCTVQQGNRLSTLRTILGGQGSLAQSPGLLTRECEAQLIHYPSLAQVAPQNETRGIERSRSTSTT